MTFSTKHDKDLVNKWLKELYETGCCSRFESNINWWDTYEELVLDFRDIDVDEGEGDDFCPYDDEIQEWIDDQDQ